MDDSDEAGGVCMVGYNALASFEGVEDMQEAFVVETADAEAFEPHLLPKAANAKQHKSHLVMQEPSRVSGIDPDGPKPSPMSTDHLVTLPIDQAPASAVARAMTYDMPYHKAIRIPFAAASGPMHSDSIKQIPFTFLDIPNPPSIHTEANSPVEGSANANGSTTKD
jgi:hypothetical protein